MNTLDIEEHVDKGSFIGQVVSQDQMLPKKGEIKGGYPKTE
jgi:hypothetical protein